MYEYNAVVDRVVDGDTIDVNIDLGFQIWHKARVRMLGIDTPESRTRNKAEKALGLASKQRLKDMLKGQKVKIACSKEKGKFGRVLATVITVAEDGTETDCNNQLCVEGHARPYSGGKKIPWV